MMPSLPLSVERASSSPLIDGDFDCRVRRHAEFRRGLLDRLPHHGAGDGVDGRLARRQRQAGARHHADAGPGRKADARSRRRAAHAGADQRAMGDVRIIARVLHHAGLGIVRAARKIRQGEGDARPARQADLHRIGRLAAGDERGEGRPRRRRGAGARGPAAAQRRLFRRVRAVRRVCHGGHINRILSSRHCARVGLEEASSF